MAGKANKPTLQSAGVIGAGAWGTALAQSMRLAGRDVVLWGRDPHAVEDINLRHRNEHRLPGIPLDPALVATGDIAAAAKRDFLLLAVPAQQVRAVTRLLRPHWQAGRPLVICAKGLEQGTGKNLVDIALTELGATAAVLSGPSFAADVARGLPTAVTLAAVEHEDAMHLAAAIGHRTFRIYSSDDLVGVQLGGAVKNVLAIAAGILAGRRLGASAHAALVTRAFSELTRFGRHFGARHETLTGLSCLGDLILTCNSAQSRNFTLGRHLGEGMALAAALEATGGIVEGVATAAVVAEMAEGAKPRLDMPIASAVHRIVGGGLSIDDAIGELLSRPQKAEG